MSLMRGQGYAEFMVVISISALGLLLSTSIYSSQLSEFRAHRDWFSARQKAIDLSLAVSNAFSAGNGTTVNVTIPSGYSAQFLNRQVKVFYDNISVDYPVSSANVTPPSLESGSYTISNSNGVISIG